MLSLKVLIILGLTFRKVICMRKNNDDYHYRLSENVVPLIYNVTLALDTPHNNLYINGNVTTTIQIINATTFINFHCSAEIFRNIKEISLYGIDPPHIASYYLHYSIHFKTDTQITYVKYDPDVPLPIGKYKLGIKFAAYMVDKEYIIKHEFTDRQSHTWFILSTSMKPTLTRHLFPCWDEPALKAKFNISINYDRNYIALSNMRIEKLWYAGDTVWSRFGITPVMSTYQLAIVLTNYIGIEDTDGNTWYVRQRIQQVTFGRNISKIVASYLSQYTSRSSPISKINYISAPFLRKAEDKTIGKFGLSIFNERYFAYNEKLHRIDKKINITILVAQQIAHQWFGNLISPSWWTHLWLNNVLATFFGYYALSKVYPDSQMRHFFLFQLQQLPRSDISASCIDTSKNIETPQDINELYFSKHSSACYMKGAALMFMLKAIISEDVLQKVIIDYLTKYQNSSVTPNDFWTCLQTAIQEFIIYKYDYHAEIKEIMENWLTQTKYPVVNFQRNSDSGEILLTQEEVDDEKIEWWSLQTNKKNNSRNKWWIPISMTRQSNLNFSNIMFTSVDWLTPRKYGDIKVTGYKKTDWVIINLQHAGYYRVNYDRTNWLMLADYLNSDQYMNIHVLHRAHLIDDAYFFVTKKKLEPDIFWYIIKYLKKEKDYTPWYSMKTILSDMSPLFLTSDSVTIKKYIIDILKVLLKEVGYQEKADDTESVKLKRLLAVEWTCRLGLPSCRLLASIKLTSDLISPGMKKFLPWWKNWTPCIGMMGVHIALWKKLFFTYFDTKDIEILEHLTCSEDPEIIIYYLIFIANDCKLITDMVINFDLEDCTKIYNEIIKKHAEKETVLNSILKNFYVLKPSNMSTLSGLEHIVTNLYSMRQVEKLRTFITNNATIMEKSSEFFSIFNSTVKKRLHNIYKVNVHWQNFRYFH